jgi:3-hydroxymyristoyl/3-hydroxydecanoyl-(acyl carrier protein) dehydratase
MSTRTLDSEALKGYLPHRGINLLPDSVTIAADGRSSVSLTRVGTQDPRGRCFFMRNDGSGRATWPEPVLAELMALTGVPLLHEQLAPGGQVAVFSMISQMTFGRLPRLDEEIVGHARIERQRTGFTQFTTRCECAGEQVFACEVMSGASTLAEISGGSPVRPLADPTRGTAVDPARFAWKPPALRFIDRIVAEDPVARRLVCAYTYPADHPLVPGHFPGAPLMMGVTQWQAVADAAWLALQRFGISTPVTVQGRITREDGSEVLDVRELLLDRDGDTPLIRGCKRLAFRSPVRPGDGILITVIITPA